MTSDSSDDPAPRGRPFAEGNPGRKPGSRNKLTRVASEILQEAAPELVRVLTEKGKAGDLAALKILAPRFLPRNRPVELDLPQLNRPADAVAALAGILEGVATGQITPMEAAALAAIVESFIRSLNAHEVECRLESVENALRET